MERFIPFRPGMEMGHGFNTVNGEVRGFAVDGAVQASAIAGQQVESDTKVVESQEQMLESLNISVEAEGRYGLFSAEGRFALANSAAYTAQSTFVVARCTVENAFRQVNRPKLQPEAEAKMRADGPEAFRRSYGDSWIRGMRTGGELYAVFQLTASSQESQRKVAASLQAQVQGLLASGSVKTSVEALASEMKKVSSLSTTFFQRSGIGDQISPVNSPEEIEGRLKAFPGIAQANPSGYQAQIVDYEVLALPPFDEVGYRQRIEALEDYARLKLRYSSSRAEIDLARHNRDLFLDLPDPGDLSRAYDAYTTAINGLNKHARRVANREAEPELFVAGDLPLIVFVKKAPDAELVSVPDVRTMTLAQARALLQSRGLAAQGNGTAVAESSGETVDMITGQVPAPGTEVAPGTNVVLNYRYKASNRFKWAKARAADVVLVSPHLTQARSVLAPRRLGR